MDMSLKVTYEGQQDFLSVCRERFGILENICDSICDFDSTHCSYLYHMPCLEKE